MSKTVNKCGHLVFGSVFKGSSAYVTEKREANGDVELNTDGNPALVMFLHINSHAGTSQSKTMTRQLILCGFHRSGTSMSMQALAHAGLHTGDQLIDALPSNPDGHYEDMEAVQLHDRWLADNGSDWCFTGGSLSVSDQDASRSLTPIINRLSNSHRSWGIKDPRAALFLQEWFNALPQPGAIFVYRHYASCFDSLRRRQAQFLLQNPDVSYEATRFWTNSTLALEAWLAYNQALLVHAKKHKSACLVVAQESILNGFNLVGAVNEKFNLALQENASTGVDPGKSRARARLDLPGSGLELTHNLEDTWNALQELSTAPTETFPKISWRNQISNVKNTTTGNSHPDFNDNQPHAVSYLDRLHQCWDRLAIAEIDLTLIAAEQADRLVAAKEDSAANEANPYTNEQCVNAICNTINFTQRPNVHAAIASLGNNKSSITALLIHGLALHPEDSFLQGLLGKAYVSEEQFLIALPYLINSAKGDTNDPSVWFHLGLAQLNTGDAVTGINSIDSALALHANADHQVVLLRELLKLRKFTEAGTRSLDYHQQHKADHRFVTLHADALFASGQQEKALQWCALHDTAKASSSEIAFTHYQLLTHSGNKVRAQACFDRAILRTITSNIHYRANALAVLQLITDANDREVLANLWCQNLARFGTIPSTTAPSTVQRRSVITPDAVTSTAVTITPTPVSMNSHSAARNLDTLPKVAMSILVRDEVDIIEHNIRYHAAMGIEQFVVTDNASVDGTRELLATLATEFDIDIIDEPSHTIDQDYWVTRMAEHLQIRGKQDWVIHNDADEFWVPPQASIPDAIAETLNCSGEHINTVGVLNCKRFNMLPNRRDLEKANYAFYLNVLAATRAVPLLTGEQPWSDDNSNCLARPVMDKVLTRVQGLKSVGYGNHGAEHQLAQVGCDNITILHFPVRTFAQFKRKVVNYGESLAKNQRLPAASSLHLRYWYDRHLAGKLHEDYAQITFSDERLRQLLADHSVQIDSRINAYFTASLQPFASTGNQSAA